MEEAQAPARDAAAPSAARRSTGGGFPLYLSIIYLSISLSRAIALARSHASERYLDARRGVLRKTEVACAGPGIEKGLVLYRAPSLSSCVFVCARIGCLHSTARSFDSGGASY